MFRLLIMFLLGTACARTEPASSSLREQSDGSRTSEGNIAEYEKSLEQSPSTSKGDDHQDEFVATCIARNKVTRQVFRPFVDAAAAAKVLALTDCITSAINQGKNPCDCEIAACSPIEAPGSVPELIAAIIEDKFPGQSCN